jgi:perosamine synthetase
MTIRIPLAAPDISENDIQAVSDVLRSPRLSLGPRLEEFERVIAEYVGVPHAIAVSSGTSGLHLCVRALGIGEGDEVIVPSFTFVAVANAVRYERAIPVFVDIDHESLNLDPRRIEAAITPRTVAIIVPHTFGRPADLSPILDIARRHSLYMIEDACEAIGAEYKGQKVGTLGDAGVFAFYPNKQITTGEGGIVVTRKGTIAERVRSLRNQGRTNSQDWFQHTELGYNYRISEINCALGISQMSRLDLILARREVIAREYDRRLSGLTSLKLPRPGFPQGRISWFAYSIRLDQSRSEEDRDLIVRDLGLRGIETGRYFAPIHLQPIYRNDLRPQSLAVTESAASRSIALPFFNQIQQDEIEEVCHELVELIQSAEHSNKASLARAASNRSS